MTDSYEVFEKIPDGVTIHDPSDGSILFVNAQFCEMLGYDPDERDELELSDVILDEPPYSADEAQKRLDAAKEEGSQTFEWYDETKDGERLPVEVNLQLVEIAGQDRILAVVRDITERKARERELEQVRERMEFALETTDAMVWEWNVDTDEATFHPSETEIYGRTIDEWDEFLDLVHPDDREDVRQSIERALETGEQKHEELRITTEEGVRWIDAPGKPVVDEDGTTRLVGIAQDITERKRQEERFRAFIEQSTDLISVLAPDGTIQYESPSLERIGGYDPEELIGDVAFEYVHPDDRSRVVEAFEAAIEDPEYVPTAEYRFLHKDGSWVWLESIGNNQLNNPAIEGFVVNSREITDRKRYEQELERQNERLEEFASVISHDLRNPLTVAMGRAELAAAETDNEHVEHVQTALDRMEALIEDVLSLARAGDTIGETEPVEMDAVATTAWSSVAVDDADLTVEDVGRIQADRTRCTQLLENLFRNAVQHGGETVTVTVGALSDGFYVADDGDGIPEDEREKVFQAGYTTAEDGTGFGLSIVKRIADGHGWEVDVTESGDGGARFEITGVVPG